MATSRKCLHFFGESTTLGSYNFMTWRDYLLQMRPDFIASGTNHDLRIGQQSYSAASPSSWHGDNRSWNSATNGITIATMASVIATRLGAAAVAATHAIVLLEMNDALGGVPAATSLSDMNTLVTNAHAASGSLKILVMQAMNQLNSPSATTIINSFNSGLAAALAGHSAYCWTAANATLTANDFGDNQQVHENARGALKIALAVNAAPDAFWT